MARIAHWTFDETPRSRTAADSESDDGTAQDGVFQSGATTDGAGSGVFDGNNDYVEIPTDAGFDLDTGSIVITFTQDTASTGDVPYGSNPAQTLFSCDSMNYDNGGHLAIFLKSDGNVGVRHQDTNSSHDFEGGHVTPGHPTSVSYTWSPNGSQLIVDGVVVDTGSDALTLAGNSEPLIIGASQAHSGDGVADDVRGFFDGKIEGIAIHDTPVEPDALPCLTTGTLVRTANGAVPVEALCVGDLVYTLNDGPQPIRWIGSRRVALGQTGGARNRLRPVRISAGALGRGLPTRDLLVSRQHRMLISSRIAGRMFGSVNVLVAANKLIALPGICIDEDVRSIEYFHLMMDRHAVIFAEGAPTESLYVGTEARRAIPAQALKELFALFPDLEAESHRPRPALPIPPGRRQRQLVSRHRKNNTPLLGPLAVAARTGHPGQDCPT